MKHMLRVFLCIENLCLDCIETQAHLLLDLCLIFWNKYPWPVEQKSKYLRFMEVHFPGTGSIGG